MSEATTSNSATQMASKDYFDLANQYLSVYQKLSEKIQNPSTTPSERETLYSYSEPLLRQAYEFQRLGGNALTAQLNVPVTALQGAVKEAAQAISNIAQAGKIIEVASDLVAIAALLAVPAIKPASLLALPGLVRELEKDVKALRAPA